MATVAQLRARRHATIGYLLAIEGLPHLWTTVDDITGGGVSSWIGTSLGNYVVVGGLHVPESVTFAVKDGMPSSPGASFGLTDFDGTVAGYFGNIEPSDIDYTNGRLLASSTAASATIGGYGDTINLHDRNIGTEAIGPSGERRHFAAFPNDSLPGMDHASADGDYSGSLVPVPVTNDPYLMEGRRVTLWRLYRDDDGSWPAWTDQASAGPPIFWGTLRVLGRVEGKTWWIKCDGPESLLNKLLNKNAPSEWLLAEPAFTLSTDQNEREDLMACSFQKVTSSGTVTENGVELFSTGDAITSTDKSGVRGEIDTFIGATATAGTNKYTGNSPEGLVKYASVDDGFGVQIENDTSGKAGVCRLVLHEKVWRLLGYDPWYQAKPDTNLQTLQDVEFRQLDNGAPYSVNGTTAAVPGPGYWEATFRTRKLGAPASGASAAEQTNDENWRYYRPVTPAGTYVVDHTGGQELGVGVDPVYCEGQLGRPPADVQIDGADVEASRWWLMRAPYRGSADEDVRQRYQVFKGSWVVVGTGVESGVMAEGSFLQTSLYIERFEDPRLFGIDDDKLDRPWAVPQGSEALAVMPLAALRYSPENVADYAHHVLLRLLLSTGTASVTGNEDADDPPTLTAGDNDHSDASGKHAFATDAETADLGLAIPESLVNWNSFLATANQLPGGWGGPLNRCVVAWTGAAQAAEVIAEVMEGRGWALGLAGGKYTLFPRYGDIDAADAVASLGSSSWHSPPTRPGHVPGTSIRAIEPVDRWVVKSGRHPDSGEYQGEYEIRARDEGAGYRQGRRKLEVKAWGLMPDTWQGPAPQNKIDAVAMFGGVASTWRAQPHMRVTCTVQRVVGEALYPGDVVTITNEWLPDLDGGYGITSQPARVLQARHRLDGGQVELELQVEGIPGGRRRWAPIARLLDDVTNIEDRYDSATYTWKCHEDAFGHGDAGLTSDVEWFAEPSWSSLGGGMLVHVWQYGGGEDGWEQTASFTVSTVDTANHTITATGVYTGTWYRRKYTILVPAPYASQTAAWVKAMMLVTTKANGKFGAGSTRGWKLAV